MALVLCLVALVHLAQALWRLNEHRAEARPLAGWMTPRYILHHTDIPPNALAVALGLRLDDTASLTLDEIARRTGLPLATVIARLEALRPAHTQPPAETPQHAAPASDGKAR